MGITSKGSWPSVRHLQSCFPSEERFLAVLDATVLRNPWIPHRPHPKQAIFLGYEGMEAMYGGAAGGGKSDALLMGALQYVEVPGYSALILRRTYKDLALPGALMDRAFQWLSGSGARWHGGRNMWEFPGGATVSFGYLDNENDKYRYQSAEFQYIALDELTQFTESQYLYMFSRLRRLSGVDIPLRMRSASNPGGVGHQWVYERFVKSEVGGRLFIPATVDDNPSLDREEYVRSLMNLDAVTRDQLLNGDWGAYEAGRFRASWFRRYRVLDRWTYLVGDDGVPYRFGDGVTYAVVDPAASSGDGSDYTVIGIFTYMADGNLLVRWVDRGHYEIPEIVPRLKWYVNEYQCAYVVMEAVGFQSGLAYEADRACCGPVLMVRPVVGKLERAVPAMLMAESGRIWVPDDVVANSWVDPFLDELKRFTGIRGCDAYDDQVDVLSYAVACISQLVNTSDVGCPPLDLGRWSVIDRRWGRGIGVGGGGGLIGFMG